VQILTVFLVLIIPFQSIKRNYVPLKALQHDTTLEKLADDILASAPQGSMLNLSDDTSIFAVVYAYYVQKKRPDIRLVMFPQMQFPYYFSWMKHHYNDIVIPPTPYELSYPEYLKTFLDANGSYRSIVSERMDKTIPEYWVPYGLLVMYYKTLELIPPRGQLLAKNIALWQQFQDPYHGVIGVYQHMMLNDVLRYYADKRLTLAHSLLLFGDVKEAQQQMSEAARLSPKNFELFMPYLETLLEKKQCQETYDTLGKITNLFVYQKKYLDIYHRLYEMCPDLQQNLFSYEKEYQDFMLNYGEKIK